MFSFVILKQNQIKETVIFCFIQWVFFLFQECLMQWFTEIEPKLRKIENGCRGEDCIDEMLRRLKKSKGDPKILKK